MQDSDYAKLYALALGYLAWLNLVWEPKGVSHHLEEVRRASNYLGEDVHYWSQLIRDDNWRASLVGSVCVIVSNNRVHLGDLCFRFTKGSMVAPQLAVAIGLIYPEEAVPFFKNSLKDLVAKKHPLDIVAAQTALVKLGAMKESEVTMGEWFSVDRDSAELAHRVVNKHWDFWSLLRQNP